MVGFSDKPYFICLDVFLHSFAFPARLSSSVFLPVYVSRYPSLPLSLSHTNSCSHSPFCFLSLLYASLGKQKLLSLLQKVVDFEEAVFNNGASETPEKK